jgi:hypothetical protein
MEMAVRSMEMVETVMETDGDGFGGTSLSRQDAGTETSVPQNLSGKNADFFRVFHWEALYRRRGIVRSGPGGLTIGGRGQGLERAPWWWGCPLAPLWLPFGPRPSSEKNRSFGLCFGLCFVQFREYFMCSFSKTQKQQKTRNRHYGILSIG